MITYILLVLIIVLLLYIGKNLECKLDKVEQGIENLIDYFLVQKNLLRLRQSLTVKKQSTKRKNLKRCTPRGL